MRTAVLAAMLIPWLTNAVAAPQCKPECIQALTQSGAPSYEVQRQCCVEPSRAPQKVLGQFCHFETGLCKMVQPDDIDSACVCSGSTGPILGRIIPGDHWTTRSAAECQNHFYVWNNSNDRMTFTDEYGQVDVEKIIETRKDGYLTETISSHHKKTSPEVVGQKWEYYLQQNGTVRIQKQGGQVITLTRC